MTVITRRPMVPVCIVCHKPAELTADDEWQHASTEDGIACNVYPMRVTERPVRPIDATADYDRQLLDSTRELCALHTPEDIRAYLAKPGNTAPADYETAVYFVLGRLQAHAAELVRWLDRIPEANRG